MNLGIPEMLTLLVMLILGIGIIYGLSRLVGRGLAQGKRDAEDSKK